MRYDERRCFTINGTTSITSGGIPSGDVAAFWDSGVGVGVSCVVSGAARSKGNGDEAGDGEGLGEGDGPGDGDGDGDGAGTLETVMALPERSAMSVLLSAPGAQSSAAAML